ncbi:hypothetical protein V2J09_002432 [Rumex salicifolius]
MVSNKKFVVQVEKAKAPGPGYPSMGPVYRNEIAKDGFPPLLPGFETCWDIFSKAVEKYPNNAMLGYHHQVKDEKEGRYVWLKYKDVYDIVLQVGASIRTSGVTQGGRCGIYGTNCPNWVISMQACNAHGLYCVPLYDSLGAGAVEFILCHAEVSIAFVEEKKIPEVFKTLPKTTKFLKTLVSFGSITSQQREVAKTFNLAIYSWHEFLLLGNNQQFELPTKQKTDICTIMYTSGTTSEPKGVMISNETIVTVVSGINFSLKDINQELKENDVYLSYLPLAHIFDRVLEELLISAGASIGYWRGEVKLLFEDINELKPTILCAVPRVLDRIYSGLVEKVSSGSFLKRTIFNMAYYYKLHNMNQGYKHDEAAPLMDKIVFSKVKQGLGGNIRLVLSGGAPLASSVETFLRVVTCAHVLQGYGLTESCAASCVAQPDEMSMIGTVGPPAPNVDVCLESVSEMGYDALSDNPRGEICLRGKTLFSGYYKREDLTKEVMNIFKLAQGEYVSVESLENIYGLSSAIDSIWIYGNSFESFLVAVVNPNRQTLESWADEIGLDGEFSSLCEHPKAKAYIVEQLNNIARENKLRGFEFVKGVHLDPIPFDIEHDLITPTFKKKRPQLLKHYKGVIDGLYKGSK